MVEVDVRGLTFDGWKVAMRDRIVRSDFSMKNDTDDASASAAVHGRAALVSLYAARLPTNPTSCSSLSLLPFQYSPFFTSEPASVLRPRLPAIF